MKKYYRIFWKKVTYFFKSKCKGIVTEKDFEYFTYKYKKARDAAKIYCLKCI